MRFFDAPIVWFVDNIQTSRSGGGYPTRAYPTAGTTPDSPGCDHPQPSLSRCHLSCQLSAEWHDAAPNHMTSSDCKRLNPGAALRKGHLIIRRSVVRVHAPPPISPLIFLSFTALQVFRGAGRFWASCVPVASGCTVGLVDAPQARFFRTEPRFGRCRLQVRRSYA